MILTHYLVSLLIYKLLACLSSAHAHCIPAAKAKGKAPSINYAEDVCVFPVGPGPDVHWFNATLC